MEVNRSFVCAGQTVFSYVRGRAEADGKGTARIGWENFY